LEHQRRTGNINRAGDRRGAKGSIQNAFHFAKATQMTKSQKGECCQKKRQAQNTGPKPTNVSTFTKRKKVMGGGYMGRSIKGEYGGVNLSNPSYVKYYKGMI
jgi:hypothetical protein